jgi:hypothetical protein
MLDSPLALRALPLVLIGALTTACSTTTMISPLSLPGLSHHASHVAGEPYAVQDLDGNLVMVDEPFSVKLEPLPVLAPEWARWSANAPAIESPLGAEIHGPMLVLQGQTSSRAIQVPLAYVQRVRVREFSPGKTAGLVVGATLGGLFVVAGTVLIAILSTGNGFGK